MALSSIEGFKIKNSIWLLFSVLLGQMVLGQMAWGGELSFGARFLDWTSNYSTPFNGWELWAPLSVNFNVKPNISLYGQTEFGHGSYTDSVSGTETLSLTNLSDTVIGGEFHLQTFSTPSILNIGLNLPTGDSTWETKQINASIPTEFVDSRYRGRGFGASALYGLSFASGDGAYGVAAGYLYSGAFNPSYGGTPVTQLKLNDALFVGLNHVQPYSGNQNEIIRLSTYYSLPGQMNGQNNYQLGTNFNASYSWANPSAFSFELGAQYWLAGQIAGTNGGWAPESKAYYGPRFYFNPSYNFGNFELAASLKYVLANGYAQTDPAYDGGGFLWGIEPSYKLKLDGSSNIKITAAFDNISWLNVMSADGTRDANAIYNLWTFSTMYEIKL